LDLLRPLILYSHGCLRECREVCTEEVDVVVALAFRQCLEFADAVDILLRHMVIAPAAAQARSALEHAPQVVLLARRRDPVLAAAYLLSSLRQLEHELERKQKAPGLDEEDRDDIKARLEDLESLYADHARDHAGRRALAALKALKPGRPWFAMENGPGNIHDLMKEVDLGVLSNFYSDLNPVVHGGMPLMATAAASGEPGTESSREWLRSLRVSSPWRSRPIRATGLALVIALIEILSYFGPRLARSISKYKQFQKEHNRRCERAEMPELAIPEVGPAA
jgi:hypothetical protein